MPDQLYRCGRVGLQSPGVAGAACPGYGALTGLEAIGAARE